MKHYDGLVEEYRKKVQTAIITVFYIQTFFPCARGGDGRGDDGREEGSIYTQAI